MSSQFRRFLHSNVYEFALVLVLSVALGYAILSGFEASLALRSRIEIEIPLVGTLLLILYAGSWSRKARIISILSAIAYIIASIVVALVLASTQVAPFDGMVVNDVEGNHAIFVVALLATTLICYLLSRSRAGTVALTLVSVFCCSVVQFLFRGWLADEGGLVDFIIVLVASIVLIVYRRYRICMDKSELKTKPTFGMSMVVGGVVAMCSIGLSALVFVMLINPLNLSTPILKPFEYRIIPPVVEYTGTYDQYLVEDPDKFTSLLNERENATTSNAQGGSVPDQEKEEKAQNPLITFLQSMMIFSDEDWMEDFDPHMFERMRFAFVIVVILVLLAIALVIFLRIRRRDVRLKRLEDRPLAERVTYLYGFLLSRLKRLGLGKPETSTPLEFAYDSRRNLVPFTRGTQQVDFVRVTIIYQRAAYGSMEITQEEYETVRRYYRAFFGNAHRYLGTPKWLIQFWRI